MFQKFLCINLTGTVVALVFLMNYLSVTFFFYYFSFWTFYRASMELLTSLSFDSWLFISMLMLVSSLIAIYSQMYMSGYKNKSFFQFMLGFYFSMLMLSLGDSLSITLVSWEYLGLTSLFLIMFYPCKSSMYNSIMTLTFNRLGDSIMILTLGFTMAMGWKCNSELIMSPCLVIMLIACSFTKSAQIPFSSWLPAAMSAPTPISTMVHSSTLVTAGIYLVCKTYSAILALSVVSIFLMTSSLTFLMGGLLGVVEKDLKKAIAFSTMSQISVIMVFLFLFMKQFALLHMIYHAFFKSMLFFFGGIVFLGYSGQQLKSLLANKSRTSVTPFFMLVSGFSMSGLLFSASFFTKDAVLEILMQYCSFEWVITMLAGSGLTLLYTRSIFTSLKSKLILIKGFYYQKLSSNYLFLMAILTTAPTFVFLSATSELSEIFNFEADTLFITFVLVNFLLTATKFDMLSRESLESASKLTSMQVVTYGILSKNSSKSEWAWSDLTLPRPNPAEIKWSTFLWGSLGLSFLYM